MCAARRSSDRDREVTSAADCSRKTKNRPVPPKLLFPLLEKGSCEDINDEVMIRRWADLLASASLGLEVQPRLVGILGELTGKQALLLERIACNNKQGRTCHSWIRLGILANIG